MSSPSAVVCREIFDDNSQPSVEEISEYAAQLGIDPESESHLLPLARDGLMQALPAPWKAYYDDKIQSHYYYNEDTKKTQWEHPLDHVYRELVKKARDASVHDDTCASVQELPTYEDYTKNLERVETKVESDEELSTDSENHGTDAEKVRDHQNLASRRLAPLGRAPFSPLARLDKKLGDTRISPLRRSVDSTLTNKPSLLRNASDRDLLSRPTTERPKLLFKQHSEIIDLKMHILNSPEEENFSPLLAFTKSDKGLPLSGKGNMFLKVSKSDLPSPDTDKSLPLDSATKSDPPKGILREKLSDVLHKKVDSINSGKLRQPLSFEEDRKSVRFKLENLPEPNLSPGSNSSSEQNDAQSSIISAAPHSIPSPIVLSPRVTSPVLIPSSPIIPQISSNNSMNPPMSLNNPLTPHLPLNQILLTPLSTRPPLPPRPGDSPREVKSVSGSERESIDSFSPVKPSSPIEPPVPIPLPRILSPLKQKPDPLPSNKLTFNMHAKDIDSSAEDSESMARGTSPRRRVLRPPPGDYIKPDLFQKNFQKISDLVRPGDIETASVNLEEPVLSEKETRPRSPMIPQKSKISINLMESIESETSLDSPDREFANLDLNDLDDSNDKDKEIQDKEEKLVTKEEDNSDKKSVSDKTRSESIPIPEVKIPSLDFSKSLHSESEESKRNSFNDESKSKSNHELSCQYHPQIKISPTPSLGSEMRSPRLDFNKPWSPLSTFKPLNAVLSPQIKISDSVTSLAKGLTSPRLDGVILSQGKSSSDNVVVVYQFETQEEITPKPIKSPLMPDMGTRDMIDRNKADERRRLELALQKELENIRVEWSVRERKLRAELQEELKEAEEKFMKEKKVRLKEQAERHAREIEEELATSESNHKQLLDKSKLEQAERYRREVEAAEKEHRDNMSKLQQQYREQLIDRQRQLEIENERALSELRSQLQSDMAKERSRMLEENRATIDKLREEHAVKVTELRHDYRAEVERLRTQHACHLEEVRSRLASERAASGRLNDERALQEKYKCLKEKYVRLKHDVKMSIERRNKRREMSMTTGSETEKSNSHKANQSLERHKELNETTVSAVIEHVPLRMNNNTSVKYNNNETSYSESNAHKTYENNNHDWKVTRDNSVPSAETSQVCEGAARGSRTHKRAAVAFREPPGPHRRDKHADAGATTDCQDSSDATTADEKPKEVINGHSRRRCFTRLKSASTSRLNYSPKRSDGWSSPLESLRQQLRKLDDLEDQFPDLALQPAYSLRYPFTELGCGVGGAAAGAPELEFVRHRALVEREGMRRARAALKRRSHALRTDRAANNSPPSEEREMTELEVALHRARALLGEKEIRLRHIERALTRLADVQPSPLIQEVMTSEASSGSEGEGGAGGAGGGAGGGERPAGEGGGAVLRSLRALHADVRDIWRALDARRPHTASPETSSCNPATTSQTRMTLSAPDPIMQDMSDSGVAEKARGLRAWLQTAP